MEVEVEAGELGGGVVVWFGFGFGCGGLDMYFRF